MYLKNKRKQKRYCILNVKIGQICALCPSSKFSVRKEKEGEKNNKR